MTTLSSQSRAMLFMGFFVALVACVETPGTYYNGYSGSSYGEGWPGYYEPYGFYYNTWAPNYYVAPFRAHEFEEHREEEHHEFEERSGHHLNSPVVAHAFRAAPASHPVPSIPSRAAAGRWRSGDRDSH